MSSKPINIWHKAPKHRETSKKPKKVKKNQKKTEEKILRQMLQKHWWNREANLEMSRLTSFTLKIAFSTKILKKHKKNYGKQSKMQRNYIQKSVL